MVVVLSVSTNRFHMSIYSFIIFFFLTVPQQVYCGLLTGNKKEKDKRRHVIKMFLVGLHSAGMQVCFYVFVLCFVFVFSKKSSHDKKKHQWGHFIVLI